MNRQITITAILLATITATVSNAEPHSSKPHHAIVPLSKVLPFYNTKAPAWCQEDMACWIGSKSDTRTDAQIIKDLPHDLILSSKAYK